MRRFSAASIRTRQNRATCGTCPGFGNGRDGELTGFELAFTGRLDNYMEGFLSGFGVRGQPHLRELGIHPSERGAIATAGAVRPDLQFLGFLRRPWSCRRASAIAFEMPG